MHLTGRVKPPRENSIQSLVSLGFSDRRAMHIVCVATCSTEYSDAVGNPGPQSSDDCKAACCSDATCQCYQWSDDPGVVPPACRTGTCLNGQDSAGIIFQGESGKSGSGTPAAGGPTGGDADGGSSSWGFPFLLTSFLVAVAYLGGMTVFNVKVKEQPIGLPNPEFWSSLSSLVIDGVGFAKQQAFGGEGSSGAVKPAKSAVDKKDDLSSHLVGDDPDYVADDADYDADDAEQGKKKKQKKPKKAVRRGSDSQVDVEVVAKKPSKKKPKARKSMPALVPAEDDGAGLE